MCSSLLNSRDTSRIGGLKRTEFCREGNANPRPCRWGPGVGLDAGHFTHVSSPARLTTRYRFCDSTFGVWRVVRRDVARFGSPFESTVRSMFWSAIYCRPVDSRRGVGWGTLDPFHLLQDVLETYRSYRVEFVFGRSARESWSRRSSSTKRRRRSRPKRRSFAAFGSFEKKGHETALRSFEKKSRCRIFGTGWYSLREREREREIFGQLRGLFSQKKVVAQALVPLSLCGPDTRVALAGDPWQLGAVVRSRLAARLGLGRDLYGD